MSTVQPLAALLRDWCEVSTTWPSVRGLASDSRVVQPGDLFCAVQGRQVHGLSGLSQALSRGCAAVAWEPSTQIEPPCLKDVRVPLIPVRDLGRRLASLAERFHHFPSQAMRLMAVTGTDGKTSCCRFLAQALGQADHACGVIGTLGYALYGGHETQGSTQHTTPDSLALVSMLATLRAGGARAVALEASSHALDQHRLDGLALRGAIFTHLSRDHLDYHGSMTAYAAAKRRLFFDFDADWCVLNLDDAYGRRWLSERPSGRCIGYSIEGRSGASEWLRASEVRCTPKGLEIELRSSWGSGQLTLPLLGRFNAANALAVTAALLAEGLTLEHACARMQCIQPVTGRMQCIALGNGASAVIDYAHTANALEKALEGVREHVQQGRVLCVFGCGGDRDHGKRPLMAAVVERLADVPILTSDNPRSEPPEDILDHMRAGLRMPQHAVIEPDRARAIAVALDQAKAGDIVLIAGKGHETWQEIAKVRHPFNDADIVRQWQSRNSLCS